MLCIGVMKKEKYRKKKKKGSLLEKAYNVHKSKLANESLNKIKVILLF